MNFHNNYYQNENSHFNSRYKYLSRLGIQKEPPKQPETPKETTKDLINQQHMDLFAQIEPKNEEIFNNDSQMTVETSYEKGDFTLNFMIKSDEQIRKNYLSKLMSSNILRNEPSQKQQTVSIFDWDDTLLCTSYLGSLGFVDLSYEVNNQISLLDNSASRILRKAISYGKTYIITNAAQGWVEYSSKLYFPKVNEILEEKNLTIISARTLYEDIYPGNSQKWKDKCFVDLKKELQPYLLTNLICLGDSMIEINAVHLLAQDFNQVFTKTIKFRENPKPEELKRKQSSKEKERQSQASSQENSLQSDNSTMINRQLLEQIKTDQQICAQN